jgi:predicted ester cyclase
MGLVASPVYAVPGTPHIPLEDDGGAGFTTQSGQVEQAAIRLFDEVLSQKAPDVCALLMAAEATTHTPHGDFAGPAGFEEYAAEAWRAFPDATFTINEWTAGADQITVRWTMAGRHLGDFGTHRATGAVVRLEGIAILHFEEGMIAKSWLQYDRMSLVEQIQESAAIPNVCPPCELP